MKVKTYLFTILVIALLSGSCNQFQRNSGQYELVVLDTLKIPFTGDIHAGTYAHHTGLIYNYQNGEYLKFDSSEMFWQTTKSQLAVIVVCIM